MSISKPLLDRLICAKYIFQKGVEVLNKEDYYSSCLAVLHFHDAVEMVLWVIAEAINCNLIGSEKFNDLLKKIKGNNENEIPKQMSLIRLNQVRVSLKHKGIRPNEDVVEEFSHDLEIFFSTALKSFLDIDFDLISLVNLIKHTRTKNYLESAEKLIAEGDYKKAIQNSAIAFSVFQKHHSPHSKRLNIDLSNQIKDLHEIKEWAKRLEWKLEGTINRQQSQLDIIMEGINLSDYRKFKRYAPDVMMSDMWTIIQVRNPGFGNQTEPTKKIALFCQSFVIGAILSMINNKIPSEYPIQKSKTIKYKVVKKCNIIVYPCKNPETIRQAEVGEIFDGLASETNQISTNVFFQDFDENRYVLIFWDSDIVYVKQDSVKIIDN